MRIDKKGKFHTLEEDIQEIWRLHGWRVIKEIVKGNTWEITAENNNHKAMRGDVKSGVTRMKRGKVRRGEAW